jgi:hypothetical protein
MTLVLYNLKAINYHYDIWKIYNLISLGLSFEEDGHESS